ncbi:glucose-6-phosphate isomerase [Actinomadura bangladeshensis]|uniref:Glucose-6-phosphate isomerase n=1 Tax=Actinomadura bangladeshensis TaxID=453573 RepID=A0A4R4PAW5_9ACTN|nr:glucose-6-phosphate isomerase [Actinomadura bangladeshensis]TDC19064.1 glucose-6-phosphate isomerase [Actinomadura bangladeshensis]
MTSVVTAGGISVTIRGAVVDEGETVLDRLVSDGVPGSLASRGAKLWGPDAVPLAARRLGWLDLPETSRSLPDRLAGPLGEARGTGLDRIVLAASGGTALAAEAVCRTAGAELTVLDTTDPHEVAGVLAGDLARTLVVVVGESIEAESLRRVFGRAFSAAGLGGAELARRFVAVAEEGSGLARAAAEVGHHLVLAEPDADDRFGALGARSLVPAALAGVDVAGLLDEASRLSATLRQPYDNPALALGAALGSSALGVRDKLVIADHGSGLAGLGRWAEQLVAGALGKDGKGLLPVVVESVEAPGFELSGDLRRVILGRRPDEPGPGREAGVSVAGPLGAQFLLWEYAVAVAARVIGVNPFDEPDTEQSRASTAALLRSEEGTAPTVVRRPPELVEGAVEVHAKEDALRGARTLTEALEAVLADVPDGGYLAVLAYLDRSGDAAAAGLRPLLAARGAAVRRNPAPVTFGWGPRYLHTAGQYHKGGPLNGAFLQITGAVTDDVPVPGRPYSLGELQLAQAFGDLRVLRALGGSAVRLHLRDRAEGLAQLAAALA